MSNNSTVLTKPTPAITMSKQPQGVAQMSMDELPPANPQQQHQSGKASRLRGGGAGKDCLLGCFACFLCCECCEGCCECIADIVCCPCEMCC